MTGNDLVRTIVMFAVTLAFVGVPVSAAGFTGTIGSSYAVQATQASISAYANTLSIGDSVVMSGYADSLFVAGQNSGIAYTSTINATGMETSSTQEIAASRALSAVGKVVGSESSFIMGSSNYGRVIPANATPYCYTAYSGTDVFGATSLQMESGNFVSTTGTPALETSVAVIGQGGSFTVQNGYSAMTFDSKDVFSQRIHAQTNYAITGGFTFTRTPAPNPASIPAEVPPMCPL